MGGGGLFQGWVRRLYGGNGIRGLGRMGGSLWL